MRHWAGMPIQTVSTVSAAKTVKIDRAAVRVPISREYENAADALARCREIMKQIEEAKRSDLQKESGYRSAH